MGYNKALMKMKAKSRLNDTFVGIINDLPNPENCYRNNELIVQQNNELITYTYEQFYNMVYRTVLEYVPRDNENPLIKVIKMLPKAIKNINRITKNSQIIKFQNYILNKYFYDSSDDNIKEKLLELENNINQLIENGDFDYLEPVLSSFDERMRSGLLKDLEVLSQLLERSQ